MEAVHQVTSAIRKSDHLADLEAGGAEAVIADVERLGMVGLADVVAEHQIVVWLAGTLMGSSRW